MPAPRAPPPLLIVDDDEVCRLVAASLVRSLGFAVVQAGDGVEALQAGRDAPLAAALMDLQMPRMDGYDAAARLREGQRSGAVAPFPIIAVTADDGPDVERRCREAGIALVLRKPLTRSALTAALSELQIDAEAHDAHALKRIALEIGSVVHELRDAIDARPSADASGWLTRPLGRAARLAEQLRAAAQAQTLAPVPVVLLPTLRALAGKLRLVLDRRLSIEVDVQPDCLDARVDAAALEAALIELCVNGRDAMPDGGRLVLSARNGELPGGVPAVAVAIGDNGVGIADAVLQRLDEPFFTTRTDRHAGLGLSAVRGFARQSGGELRIRSEIGAGTAVTLLLPLA